MWLDRAKEVASEIGVSLDHPSFYYQLHGMISDQKEAAEGELHPLEAALSREHGLLSRRLAGSEIQEGCSVRNILLVRDLVNGLIDDSGKVDEKALRFAIKAFGPLRYGLGPGRRMDTPYRDHILQVLHLIKGRPLLKRMINGVSRPFSNPHADQLIRDTLSLPSDVAITDADTTRAVLSAWMTYLRQNVGSCFATAPAILVQAEQPERLIKDLADLLNSGQMSRTVAGMTYSVPLSSSWGAADLRKPFIMTSQLLLSPTKIWLSPGVWEALKAINLVPADLSAKKTLEMVKEVLAPAVESMGGGHRLFYTTMEDVLRKLIFNRHGVTERQYRDYQRKAKIVVNRDVAVSRQGKADIGSRIERLEADLSAAQNAFKSLTDNALLKAWEFSLASFAETKLELTRWNLYSSLGMRPDDSAGIGERLFSIIKGRLEAANEEVHKQQELYDQVYYQAKHLEGRLQRARDEGQARWLKSEYTTHRNEANTHLELRDRASRRAQKLANLFDFLVDQYLVKFRSYFQEVYDADMRDIKGGPYDDSPAGFRLVYKHGRHNTAQWSLIHGPDEFVNNLASFFIAIEPEMSGDPYMDDLKNDFSYITTSMVTHVKTREFIEGAFHRMAKKHGEQLVKNPLENLDKVQKKPWVYTSGGTMRSLVQCYFGREEPPTSKDKWVESPEELMAFIIETMRQVPGQVLESYLAGERHYFLMHSPTHAFLLCPGFNLMREAMKSPTYAYTWIKENLTVDAKVFVKKLRLDAEEIQLLLADLARETPKDSRDAFQSAFSSIPGSMSAIEFRQWVMKTVTRTPGLSQGKMLVLREDQVDSLLYRMMPFRPAYQLKGDIENIFRRLPGLSEEEMAQLPEAIDSLLGGSGGRPPVSSMRLRHICLSLVMLIKGNSMAEHDYPWFIAEAMQKLELAMPTPFIFADSNWVTHYFAFLVNPGTGCLDFWRVDYTGVTGEPMSHWRVWLDGSNRSPTWGIYLKPTEYR